MLLQRFQPHDHGLDPRAGLLVLGQQLRAFADQLLLLAAQAAVFVGEALATLDQFLDAGGKAVERIDGIVVHGATIGMGPAGGQGERSFSIGAAMTYNQNLSFELTYLDFLGNANLDMRREKALTDRDQLSLVVKYSF